MGLNLATAHGFTPKRKVYILDFEGSDLHGLEVKARTAPLGEFMRLGMLADAVEDAKSAAAEMEAIDALLMLFDAVLLSWNLLDDDGEPVPPTVDGLKTLEVQHVMAIFLAWQKEVAAVPAPLPVASRGGLPSEVLSMPMETALPSRAS